MHVVGGRVLEEMFPVASPSRLDDLHDRALAGDVGPPVDRASLDVVVAAQREVVLVVVVERCLVRSRFHVGYGSVSMSQSYGRSRPRSRHVLLERAGPVEPC